MSNHRIVHGYGILVTVEGFGIDLTGKDDAMTQVDLETAKQKLGELIASALAGQDVILTGVGNSAVRLVPISSPGPFRRAGSAAGQIVIGPDFDEPLPEFAEYES